MPILKAAYEGTIRAAHMHGKQKVFLTIIGGGIFRNKLNWIAEAIEEVIPLIQDNNMQVYIVCRMNPANLNSEETVFVQRLRSIEFGVSSLYA